MPDLALDAEAIRATADLLTRRVEERFPESGLLGLARQVEGIAARTRDRAARIASPIVSVRVAAGFLVALIVAGMMGTVASLRSPREPLEAFQFIQVLEAGINDVVLVGAGVFFLVTLETRIKRRRALRALRELRAVAHVIDMHQLTKDPEWVLDPAKGSALLPPRTLSRFELSRYLDYCSEMLAILGKVAALYVQEFEDGEAVAAVNEVEALTNDLSRKIWQKLMILYAMGPERSGS